MIERNRGFMHRLHIDNTLLLLALLLCAIGLSVLYSASSQDINMVIKQMVKLGLGLALMVFIAQIPPSYLSRWSPWFYMIGLVLLILVMFIGTGKGAQRWLDVGLFNFQPSEFMKLFTPMLIAWYLADKPLPPTLKQVTTCLGLILLPVIIVAEQPDLGTAVLILLGGLSVLFLSGMSWKTIFFSILTFACISPVIWMSMHDYQRQRLLTLFNPEKDPLGTGYHIIQSKIAVGSGGLYGKGWLNGTQAHLDFLPERHTDFIFAVFCEEFGFVGVVFLISLYLLLIFRCFHVALNTQGTYQRLLAGCLAYNLFIYVFINMGMVIGQLPVVGVPLPFISYGGTSLVTLMTSLGILMSFQTHRKLLAY